MDKRKRILALTAITSVVALGGGGLAYAGGARGGDGEDKETTLAGADGERAGKVAADSVGGGSVVNVFAESEGEVAYEVEVKKPDGSTVEVEVTKGFTVASPEKGESGAEGAQVPGNQLRRSRAGAVSGPRLGRARHRPVQDGPRQDSRRRAMSGRVTSRRSFPTRRSATGLALETAITGPPTRRAARRRAARRPRPGRTPPPAPRARRRR